MQFGHESKQSYAGQAMYQSLHLPISMGTHKEIDNAHLDSWRGIEESCVKVKPVLDGLLGVGCEEEFVVDVEADK